MAKSDFHQFSRVWKQRKASAPIQKKNPLKEIKAREKKIELLIIWTP